MRIPPRIQFHTTNRCQLNCKFCAIDHEADETFMLMGNFKSFAKKCIAYGIREYELTPIVGDPMLDVFLLKRIKFLNQYGISKILFYTNLIRYGEIEEILLYEKVEVNISVYGGNREEYMKNTRCDFYDIFKMNLNKLLTYVRDMKMQDQVKLWIRHEGKDYNPYIRGNDIEKIIATGNNDWKNPKTISQTGRKGICQFAIEDNCIFPNGDISICGWFDIDKQTIIGNLYEQSLEEIYDSRGKYEHILEEQLEGKYTGICKNCTIWKNKSFKSWLFREEGYGNYVSDNWKV